MNPPIQTVSHLVGGDGQCALVSFYGLHEFIHTSCHRFDSVHWEIALSFYNYIFSIFPAIPILCLPVNAFCQTRQRSPGSCLEVLIFGHTVTIYGRPTPYVDACWLAHSTFM